MYNTYNIYNIYFRSFIRNKYYCLYHSVRMLCTVCGFKSICFVMSIQINISESSGNRIKEVVINTQQSTLNVTVWIPIRIIHKRSLLIHGQSIFMSALSVITPPPPPPPFVICVCMCVDITPKIRAYPCARESDKCCYLYHTKQSRSKSKSTKHVLNQTHWRYYNGMVASHQ